jgi:hypothetical protein
MDDEGDCRPTLDPAALPLGTAARLLAKVGAAAITEEMLQQDVSRGAPTNGDGTLNLVHYAAWLVKETSIGD